VPIGADGGTRTRTGFPPRDFKSVPPPFRTLTRPFGPLQLSPDYLNFCGSQPISPLHLATLNYLRFVARMLPGGSGWLSVI